jgi:hypothetical protein
VQDSRIRLPMRSGINVRPAYSSEPPRHMVRLLRDLLANRRTGPWKTETLARHSELANNRLGSWESLGVER